MVMMFGMVERREQPRLLLEAPQASSSFEESAGRTFTATVPPEPRIAGPVDLAHPPAPRGARNS